MFISLEGFFRKDKLFVSIYMFAQTGVGLSRPVDGAL